MSSGITFDKLVVIGIIALLLIGPDKLPGYARKLAEWARRARSFVDGARDRAREEMGPDFDEIDWKRLDPRQYDPRRIIRDALTEEQDPVQVAPARESAYAQRQRLLKEGKSAPFDPEST